MVINFVKNIYDWFEARLVALCVISLSRFAEQCGAKFVYYRALTGWRSAVVDV